MVRDLKKWKLIDKKTRKVIEGEGKEGKMPSRNEVKKIYKKYPYLEYGYVVNIDDTRD